MIKTKIPHQVTVGAGMEERIPWEHLSVAGKVSKAVAETENKNAETRMKSQVCPQKPEYRKVNKGQAECPY